MTNDFVEIEMTPTVCGVGGFFQTEASFVLDNFRSPFHGIEVKIDTGCSISTIPLKRLKVSDTMCKVLKGMDISDCVPYYLSYGVETGGLKHSVPATDSEKMNCSAMKFEHEISEFTIAGVKMPHQKICLNYDRRGNILIGMDILQDWDIHTGISQLTGKNVFLASHKEHISREYIEALRRHFRFLF